MTPGPFLRAGVSRLSKEGRSLCCKPGRVCRASIDCCVSAVDRKKALIDGANRKKWAVPGKKAPDREKEVAKKRAFPASGEGDAEKYKVLKKKEAQIVDRKKALIDGANREKEVAKKRAFPASGEGDARKYKVVKKKKARVIGGAQDVKPGVIDIIDGTRQC